MAKQCTTPGKDAYPNFWAALKAIARGAHGHSVYRCRDHWHTTSQVRSKPKAVRR